MLEELQRKIDVNKIKYSISVKNLKTEETFKYNENAVASSASIIKILIMAEVMNQISKGILSLGQRIQIKKEDRIDYSILSMLDNVNTYSLKDIITLMIVQSDNTAANILIDIAGMNNINSFGKQIGLKNTILQRKMLDFEARKQGRENLTSSQDMAIFLELLYNGIIINKNYSNLMIDILKMQLDRSMLYLDIPDIVVIAHKSGELDYIDNEVGIFYGIKGDYIFSMLTWDAISNNYARKIVGTAAKIVYDYFEN
jgi:beta-lactamase class A